MAAEVTRVPGRTNLFKPATPSIDKIGVQPEVGAGMCGNCGSFLTVTVTVIIPNMLAVNGQGGFRPGVPQRITGKVFSKEFTCLRCGEYQHSGQYWENEKEGGNITDLKM